MNWDNQLSSILSVADGSVAKMRVSRFKMPYLLDLLAITETHFISMKGVCNTGESSLWSCGYTVVIIGAICRWQ